MVKQGDKRGIIKSLEGKTIGYTIQCPHCGMHFEEERVYTSKRGKCLECDAIVCGKKLCMSVCVTAEQRLRIEEGDTKSDLVIARERLGSAINMLNLCRGDVEFHEYNQSALL